MNPDRPPFRDDWEGLALVAARLRADRAAGDPAAVAAGRLTRAQADARARIAQALAEQWRAVAARAPLPALQATPAEIRGDLEAVAAAAARRAAATPDAPVQLGEIAVPYARFASAVATLLWHQQPWSAEIDEPRIVFIHQCNQQARAQRARPKAAA